MRRDKLWVCVVAGLWREANLLVSSLTNSRSDYVTTPDDHRCSAEACNYYVFAFKGIQKTEEHVEMVGKCHNCHHEETSAECCNERCRYCWSEDAGFLDITFQKSSHKLRKHLKEESCWICFSMLIEDLPIITNSLMMIMVFIAQLEQKKTIWNESFRLKSLSSNDKPDQLRIQEQYD